MEFEKGPLKELHTIITYRAVTNYAKVFTAKQAETAAYCIFLPKF